jgi:hypothetical protein
VRRELFNSIQLTVAYGIGIVAGLIPVFAWLAAHGLVDDAYRAIFPVNARILTNRRPPETLLESVRLIPRLLNLTPYVVISLTGLSCALPGGGKRPSLSDLLKTPTPLLIAASTALFFAFAAVAPNYLSYHIAGGLILCGAFGAGVVHRLLTWGRDVVRVTLVAVVLALCVNDAWFRAGIGGRVEGITAPIADLQALYEAAKSRGSTCVCLAPMHPIFAFDVGELYTGMDKHSRRWSDTVETLLRHPPGVVLDFSWRGLVARDRLTLAQVSNLENLLSNSYELHAIGGDLFWLQSGPTAPFDPDQTSSVDSP